LCSWTCSFGPPTPIFFSPFPRPSVLRFSCVCPVIFRFVIPVRTAPPDILETTCAPESAYSFPVASLPAFLTTLYFRDRARLFFFSSIWCFFCRSALLPIFPSFSETNRRPTHAIPSRFPPFCTVRVALPALPFSFLICPHILFLPSILTSFFFCLSFFCNFSSRYFPTPDP